MKSRFFFVVFCFSLLPLAALDKDMPPPMPQAGKKEIMDKKQDTEMKHRKRRDPFALSNQADFIAGLPEEEQAHFKKLHQEDPMKFKHAVFQYMQKEHRKNIESCKKLRKEYLDAVGTDREEKAKAALREELSLQIHKNLEHTERYLSQSQKQLDAAQKRLDRFRKEYEKRKKNAPQFIDQALKDWSDPNFVLPEPKFKKPLPKGGGKAKITSRP